VRGLHFTKLYQNIGRSWQLYTFVSIFGSLAAFSNAGCSNLSDILTKPNFTLFDPPVKIRGCVGEILIQIVKIRGCVGEILIQIVEPTIEPPEYI